MEKQLLSALVHDRKAYDKLRCIIDEADVLSDQATIVYENVCHYYEQDTSAAFVDKEWLKSRLMRKHERHAQLFEGAVNDLNPVSTENIMEEFIALRRARVGEQLAAALIAGKDKDISRLRHLYDQVEIIEETGEDSKAFIDCDIDELLEVVRPENMMPMYPKELNERIGGGLPIGGHMILFGPPESGKTALAINTASGMANAKRRVLYVGNEDPMQFIIMRVISRLSGISRLQYAANVDSKAEAIRLARERGYGNIIFKPMAPGTISDVREAILEYGPDAVVLDQLTNLALKGLSKTEKFEELAYRARMLFKEAGVAGISVCQAGDSAVDKLVLDQSDVYYSNTGIPAQCDIMVGIGNNPEYNAMNRRMLSLPKSKFSGNHEPFPVNIDTALSRIVGV